MKTHKSKCNRENLLDIFQQITYVIKQKEQYTDLTISNNTDRCERQIQVINIEYIYIYINRNLQIIKDSQTKCVKGWTIEIKSCVWYNLLKADFTSHTFTVVLWDSWTSASQDKMIFQYENKAHKVMLCELLNASFSLFDTKMNEQKSHWKSFLWEVLFHE